MFFFVNLVPLLRNQAEVFVRIYYSFLFIIGNDRNGGGGGDYGGGWNDRGGAGSQEVQFVVPANKCGVIIGKGKYLRLHRD